MPDDADSEFDPPDPERVYRNYLETCRRAGVEPVSRERVQGDQYHLRDGDIAGVLVARIELVHFP